MNAQTQISNSNQSVGLLNLEAFELSQRIAKMLSNSTLVPEQYRATIQKKSGKDEYGNQLWREEPNPNGLSNCVIALNMSNRMGADPLMVMQNLYLVNGRPSWSSQFIMAGINSSGRFSALRFEIKDLGEKEVECTETVWENRKPKKVTKTVKINDFSCVAWAIERETGERLESSKITIEMAVKEGWYTKDGSKWQTMPEQMLRYRAASFFGRVYAPELLMGLRSAEEEQDRIIDVTPTSEAKVINASDFKNIKNLILKAKTLNELEESESSIYALSDDSERNELIKLWKASVEKFKATEAAVKKPEPKQDEAPPVEAEQPKKPTSTEIRKEYLDQIESMNNVKDLETIIPLIDGHEVLTTAHKTYLVNLIKNKIEDINKADVMQETKSVHAVDDIKSQAVANGLKIQITDAPNIDQLTVVAQTIRESKEKLTMDHMSDVLQVYGARKTFLENQQDMFADVKKAWIDSAIERIENARNQDDINAEYIDPMYEEQSDKDKQRLNIAAQKREAAILG